MALAWPDPFPAHGPVVLRPPRDSDLPLVAELASDPYIPQISTVPEHYTDAAGLEYLARQHSRLATMTGWSFVVADAADDRGLGQVFLGVREIEAGRASAGYALAPASRGRGLGTAALRALMGFAWTLPELYRVELYIEAWNTGSLGVAANAGFVREGRLRSHQEIGGTRRDVEIWAAVRA